MKTLKMLYHGVVVLLVISCVTVNVYFPEAAVQAAADKFVEKVKEGAGATENKQKNDKSSWLIPIFSVAYAEANISTNSPKIKALENQIIANYKMLFPHIQSGAIFETDNGYLQPRGDLDARTRSLLNQHNEDRKAVYQEILRFNNLPGGELSHIEKIFGRSWKK